MGEENQIKQYMNFIIGDICEKIGPRPPCSPQEAEASQYLNNELKKFADESSVEEFVCHPGAYRLQFHAPFLGLLNATAFYTLYTLTGALVHLLITFGILLGSLVIIQTNIQRNIEFLDPLFKPEESTNVVGKFYPAQKTMNRVVIGGHHDSNWEFPLLRKSWKLFGILVSVPIIFTYLFFGVVVLRLVNLFIFYIDFRWIDVTILLVCIFILALYLILGVSNEIVSDLPVMGANDNLTALAVMLALASTLKAQKLLNTEVWLVSHGCEEIGDRGSKRFVKKHLEELQDAYVINIDMIGGKNTHLRFVTSEVVFLIKLSKKIAESLAQVAAELDIPFQLGHVEAFTDSMAYAQNNIHACSIVGFPEHGVPPHYHTREDTIDNLEFQNLWDCYQILQEFLNKVDSGKIFLNPI